MPGGKPKSMWILEPIFGAGLAAVMIGLLWMGGGGCVLVDVVLVSGVWGGYDYE